MRPDQLWEVGWVRFLPLLLVARCYALGIANHGVLGGVHAAPRVRHAYRRCGRSMAALCAGAAAVDACNRVTLRRVSGGVGGTHRRDATRLEWVRLCRGKKCRYRVSLGRRSF